MDAQRMNLPSVYPILDFSCFATKSEPLRQALRFAEALVMGGATILQYRDKTGDTARMLSCARELRRLTQGKVALIINDRADICLAAQADGVHLGQDDLSPTAAREILLAEGNKRSTTLVVGFSTHNLDQVREA